MYAAEHHVNDSANCLVVKSPDTDVFVILLSYALKISTSILFETGSGNMIIGSSQSTRLSM